MARKQTFKVCNVVEKHKVAFSGAEIRNKIYIYLWWHIRNVLLWLNAIEHE